MLPALMHILTDIGSWTVTILTILFVVFVVWAVYVRVRIFEIDEVLDGNYKAHFVKPAASSLSGRTPPLRIDNDHFLEFVGGHTPCQPRNARYWFGAQLFQAAHPHAVVAATGPLIWGTEASPTIFSPRPYAGHPLCIFPSGVIRHGGDGVIVSCGVNDSYIALLRFNIGALLEQMQPVTEEGSP